MTYLTVSLYIFFFFYLVHSIECSYSQFIPIIIFFFILLFQFLSQYFKKKKKKSNNKLLSVKNEIFHIMIKISAKIQHFYTINQKIAHYKYISGDKTIYTIVCRAGFRSHWSRPVNVTFFTSHNKERSLTYRFNIIFYSERR